MARGEETQYEQDNLGNERRKLDTIRAQEGMSGATDEGIQQIQTAQTGSDLVLYSLPTHADEVYITEVHAHNSTSTNGTFSLFEATLNGSGSITSTVRRSVPIQVVSQATRIHSYQGDAFQKAVAVNSEFGGHVGVAVVVDHKEYNESASEQTQA